MTIRNAEYAIALRKKSQGKGYGFAATIKVLKYAFYTLSLNHVYLNVFSDNEQAIACYKKVGFKEFGRRRESFFKSGSYVDDIHMDILETDLTW